MLILIILILLTFSYDLHAQTAYSSNPLEVKIYTEDVNRFWKAFDSIEVSKSNPFRDYIKNGSPGVKGFIPYRIINEDSLYSMVIKRKKDYEKSRYVLNYIESKTKRIRTIYSSLKYWYLDAIYPPIYFVVGRFNTGGTVSEDGIIIGTEMLQNLDGIPGLVAHELIHFQQNIDGEPSLLKDVLNEGSADFLGELISGEHINSKAFEYGEKHQTELCEEFVLRMMQDDREDWLYGTSGKDERPNDLGYWIGYKITEAYFNQQNDKHQSVKNILYIKNPVEFLKTSGFLDNYIDSLSKRNGKDKEDYFKKFSDKVYDITFLVNVPNENDEVFITGNQKELADWNPNKLKLIKKSALKRYITLKIHSPALFKFTRGSWDTEALLKGIDGIPNLSVEADKTKEIIYTIFNWKDRIK